MKLKSFLCEVAVSGLLVSGAALAADSPASDEYPPTPIPAPTGGVTSTSGPMLTGEHDAAAPGTVERVCAGTSWPGWAKVDDAADPASPCKSTEAGNPYNVWMIKKITGYARGSQEEICRVKVVPLGWYKYQYKWDGNRCGHPKEKGEDNIMVIRHDH